MISMSLRFQIHNKKMTSRLTEVNWTGKQPHTSPQRSHYCWSRFLKVLEGSVDSESDPEPFARRPVVLIKGTGPSCTLRFHRWLCGGEQLWLLVVLLMLCPVPQCLTPDQPPFTHASLYPLIHQPASHSPFSSPSNRAGRLSPPFTPSSNQ